MDYISRVIFVQVLIGDSIIIEGKSEVFRIRGTRTYGGNRCIAPLILNFGTRWR